VLALRIYERDERGGAVQAELHFLVVLEAGAVVVDGRLDVRVGESVERVEAVVGEEPGDVAHDVAVERGDGVREDVGDDAWAREEVRIPGVLFGEEVLDDDGEVVRRVFDGRVPEMTCILGVFKLDDMRRTR